MKHIPGRFPTPSNSFVTKPIYEVNGVGQRCIVHQERVKTGATKKRIRELKILSPWPWSVPRTVSEEQVSGGTGKDIQFPCRNNPRNQRQVFGPQPGDMPPGIHINPASHHRYSLVLVIQGIVTSQHMGHPEGPMMASDELCRKRKRIEIFFSSQPHGD